MQGIEIVIIHRGERPSFEEELVNDVLEIVTVFSARLYGSRSHKAKKTLEALVETMPAPQPPADEQLQLGLTDGTQSAEDSTQPQ